jgi:hypothetical protein
MLRLLIVALQVVLALAAALDDPYKNKYLIAIAVTLASVSLPFVGGFAAVATTPSLASVAAAAVAPGIAAISPSCRSRSYGEFAETIVRWKIDSARTMVARLISPCFSGSTKALSTDFDHDPPANLAVNDRPR